MQANAADLELYAFADELVDVQLVLLNQEEGLFIIKCRCRSIRSGMKQVEHMIGIDFFRRELADTFLKGRRPLTKTEWDAIGVLDWQCTWLLCFREPFAK